jgi:hypothetical protein
MALIQQNSQMSGSQGNTVFSRNAGGAYTRQRTKPVNLNTSRQQLVRTNLGTLSQQWRALTAANRSAWASYGLTHPVPNRLGEVRPLSGNAVYNKLGARMLLAGLATIATPPVTATPAGLLTFSFVRTSDTSATLTFTGTPLAAGNRLLLFMSVPSSGATNPNRNQAVMVGFTAAAAASAVVMTLPKAWLVGQSVTMFASVMDAFGQCSAELMARTQA